LIVIDSALAEGIHEGFHEVELEKLARQKSVSIRQDGRQKVLAGVTSIEEVLRVTSE